VAAHRDATTSDGLYHLDVPLSEEFWLTRRVGGSELDRIDDELFSTDYRAPTQRHRSVLPEPPTVRLAESTRVIRPSYAMGGLGPWGTATWYPASEYSSDENGVEIALLIGIAVLLVVAMASAGVAFWWLA
jgi:hypothetical protein